MTKHDAILQFESERKERLQRYQQDQVLKGATLAWSEIAFTRGYTYNFHWMGRPIIQYPQDMVAMQEIIWDTQPDLIIETGVAHGGSLMMYAGLQRMMAIENALTVGVEIDLRQHNRNALESHPMWSGIQIVDGSSVAEATLTTLRDLVRRHKRTMVILDSLHTHDHVHQELQLYGPLVTPGCYLVVQDTHVDELPDALWKDRPWKAGNSPMSAVKSFLAEDNGFEVDLEIEAKLMITCARNGWLRKRA